MIILIDNYDSFAYNLVHAFGALGAEIQVFRNDAVTVDEVVALRPQAVVISPGPCTPEKAGISVELIRRLSGTLPLLGVCLGHQALGEFFGAQLVRAARPMHGKVSTINCQVGEPLFTGLPTNLSVTRYHSLVLQNLPASLQPLSHTADSVEELMALRHVTLPLYGVQFHPEALLTTHGLALLRNWMACCILVRSARLATPAAVAVIG